MSVLDPDEKSDEVLAERLNQDIDRCIQDESKKIVKVLDFQYPTRPKDGYKTVPDFDTILQMTKEELMEVDNFQIENEHGYIKFLRPVDLTDVDLQNDVTIKAKHIDIYPDE